MTMESCLLHDRKTTSISFLYSSCTFAFAIHGNMRKCQALKNHFLVRVRLLNIVSTTNHRHLKIRRHESSREIDEMSWQFVNSFSNVTIQIDNTIIRHFVLRYIQYYCTLYHSIIFYISVPHFNKY